MKCKVMFARFPGNNAEHPDSSDWFYRTMNEAKQDPRIGEVVTFVLSDTPITMGRNRAVKRALDTGCDYLLMLDSDMKPDCEPDGKPFWKTSFDFLWNLKAPAVIAAPYTGPPPHNNIYVFQFANYNNYDPTVFHLPQYTREQAAHMAGIGKCGALPTGVILYDMRCFKRHASEEGHGLAPVEDKGWFYYEWTDEFCTDKASTEDVTNTRDIALLLSQSGIPGAGVYCNWDAWAAHIKLGHWGKPKALTTEDVGSTLKLAWESGRTRDEKTVMLDCQLPPVAAEPHITFVFPDEQPLAVEEESPPAGWNEFVTRAVQPRFGIYPRDCCQPPVPAAEAACHGGEA